MLDPDPLVRGYGSADLNPDPDQHQNVTDPQHCCKLSCFMKLTIFY